MILALALRVTIILVIGAVTLTFLPKNAPRFRHASCALTIAACLLLPLLMMTPVIPSRFTFKVAASVLAAPSKQVQLPLGLIWLSGAVLVLLRFVIGVAYLSWKTIRAGGEGEIRFATVDSPLVWGWFKPVILMPAVAAGWTRERWSLAIAHEQAHVQRGDIWTSTLGVIAEAVYWFHPLMWWMTRRMREEQELACDERVLEQGSDGVAYAELLLETAGLPESRLLGCRMTGGKMKERLERILQWRRVTPWSRAKHWAAVIACTMCLGMGALFAASTTNDGPYKIGGDVSAPKLVHKQEPGYTKAAKHAKIQGVVVLKLIINAQGVPEDVHVIKSLDSGLDQKAVEAVSSWRFEPAMKQGTPVAVIANVEVNFRLL